MTIRELTEKDGCPAWLKQATTSHADVEALSHNRIVWKKGTWVKGIFKDSVWRTGLFSRGTFENSLWEDGCFTGGTFKDSIWQNGVFEGGTFRGSVWQNGCFKGGEFEDSIWQDGFFEDGFQTGPLCDQIIKYNVRRHLIKIGQEVRPVLEWDSYFNRMGNSSMHNETEGPSKRLKRAYLSVRQQVRGMEEKK